MLSPAIPAIGLLADWPPPEKEKVQTDVVRGLSGGRVQPSNGSPYLSGCANSTQLSGG